MRRGPYRPRTFPQILAVLSASIIRQELIQRGLKASDDVGVAAGDAVCFAGIVPEMKELERCSKTLATGLFATA